MLRQAVALGLGRRVLQRQLLGPDHLHRPGRIRKAVAAGEVPEVVSAADEHRVTEGPALRREIARRRVRLELTGFDAREGRAGQQADHPSRIRLGNGTPGDAAAPQRTGNTSRLTHELAVGGRTFGRDDGGPLRRVRSGGLEEQDHSVRTGTAA